MEAILSDSNVAPEEIAHHIHETLRNLKIGTQLQNALRHPPTMFEFLTNERTPAAILLENLIKQHPQWKPEMRDLVVDQGAPDCINSLPERLTTNLVSYQMLESFLKVFVRLVVLDYLFPHC